MNSTYNIRIQTICFLLLMYYGAIITRLYVIQISNNLFFTHKKDAQYKKTHTFLSERGLIVDRNNKPLALNTTTKSIFLEPHKVHDSKKMFSFLTQYFPHSAQKFIDNKTAYFLFIKRHISHAEELFIKTVPIADLHILEEPSRFYPDATITHLVGITDSDNKGLFGVEKIYQSSLAGTPTTCTLEQDARSGHYYFNKITNKKGTTGNTIALTIDSNIQHIAHTRLQEAVAQWHAKEGMVMIANPETGEILAIAQYPYCSPYNITTETIPHTNNKVCTNAYELGSVIKVFSALAALDEEVVTSDELIDCLNIKKGYIHGYQISTWHEHGIIPFSKVIELSNNFGIARVVHRLGKKLYGHYTRIGFGKKTALNWPGEQTGFINPPHHWSGQSLISLSFGYEITLTIAQLVQAFCIIACHGIQKNITLIKEETNLNNKNIYSMKSIDTLRTILENVVSQGTGKHAALSKNAITKDYKILGKTGTANMVIDGTYNTKHNMYVFAGIVEKNQSPEPNESVKNVYKRVVVTFIKEIEQSTKMYASSITAPLCQKIIEDMILYEKQF